MTATRMTVVTASEYQPFQEPVVKTAYLDTSIVGPRAPIIKWFQAVSNCLVLVIVPWCVVYGHSFFKGRDTSVKNEVHATFIQLGPFYSDLWIIAFRRLQTPLSPIGPKDKAETHQQDRQDE
ncbi:ribokinase [Fonsecaea monophora]|uniref:Ribokinase n=1 Tax=Fonsecaea monophora TaxID=254056 RepID=A0A177FM55_9EURO|nr:ribokinase [Fonsecaea monophora]KAH0845041.1 hypothetical protein FOPE_10034 [Fonsecaea pedrosoi]OAG44239.1 ribokinase [Fonsecaea monophora]